MDLERFAAAAAELGHALAHMGTHLGATADAALDVANRQSRQRFYHCPGCDDCAARLPALTGEC